MAFGGKFEAGPRTHCMAPRRGTFDVVALRDLGSGLEFDVGTERRYVIGQHASCDIVVDDPCVSRVHCVLERRDGSVFVRDKGSRNGTFINDRRVEGGELWPGNELMLGETRLLALGPRSGAERSAYSRLIGDDPVFRSAVEQARRAAASEVSVLIVGETGTGKELIAQMIHESSPRARGAFVPVNCGAIPRELIGSELYGHERGAFTGASSEHDGLFLQADRGTLFLDEIGELPLEQQPHLLRVLESRRVRRIGSSVERPIDVRIVAATNRMSGLGSERGHLRVDLYHRVATVTVRLPPLRERVGDLEMLCEDILGELGELHGARELSVDARRAIAEYPWPGNVRELKQSLRRAVAFSEHVIEREHVFATGVRRTTPEGNPLPVTSSALRTAQLIAAGVDVEVPRYDEAIRDLMRQAMVRHGTLRAAADALGMPKSTFAERAKRLGLAVPAKPKSRK